MNDRPSRVVLISGATRGIGLAVAKDFLAHGYSLSLGARAPVQLESVFAPPGERLAYHHYDACDPDAAKAWVEATVARSGRIDALINNAGINEPLTLNDDDDKRLDRLWAVNVKAPLRMTRLCLPYLEASGTGRVINLASLSGKRVRNPQVGYTMTKFAVMGLTHTIRHIAWDKGVRATALCPGFVRTDLTAHTTKVAPEDMTTPETLATLVRTLVELPNNAAVAELLVNCRLEDTL
ncbi:SDR family NAD(P)-dependent oxidoreductase [Paraburkholderia strydomiana]|uniref:SDR family NAD(P)-dependent oxidoreductase n=1 Tax=Paraburkholderia strydomiana TaxID=1245417 RepID=UPI0038BBE9F9